MGTIITRMMTLVVVVTVAFLHMTELIPELMRMRVAIMILMMLIMMIYDLLLIMVLVAGVMKMIAEVNMGIVCQGC